MVKTLTPRQKSAIERAKRNPDLQRILFRKAVGLEWFFAFKVAGFLDPTKIPMPIPAKDEGYVNIPAWAITDYLVATSPELLDPENESYAAEFIAFIRAVTTYAREQNFGNFRVWWQFSKIVPNIPFHLITADDITVVDYWLDDPYERGFVAENIGEQWLLNLLDQRDGDYSTISISLLETLYKLRTVENEDSGSNRQEVVLRFDNWHAKKLTQKVAAKVGRVLGLAAVEVFRNRLEHLLSPVGNDKSFYVLRPAVEDHGQNLSADDVEQIILQGYRDALLAYIEEFPLEAKEYIKRILESSLETTKRVAIYAIDKRYQQLSQLVEKAIMSDFFTSNFQHELWHLLHNHYPEFSAAEKDLVKKAIASLVVVDENAQNSEGATSHKRATWLSAIKDYGEDISELYREYVKLAGGEPEHPDFASYFTSGDLMDPQSPIAKDEMLSLGVEHLISRLKSYRDTGSFFEPGLEGLVKALREVVKAEPLRFYNQLGQFLSLDLAYVNELIKAYGELWLEKAKLPWRELWQFLLAFCEDIVSQDRFWSVENAQPRTHFVANRYWVVREIARLIESGTKSDEHALPEKLLIQAERVLLILLEKEEAEEFKPESDAVFVAVNSPRGHCIEALINVTLRACRMADKHHGEHVETWNHFQPTYNAELARADIGEYEFVTLMTIYLPYFLYFSKDWVLANLEKIFDQKNYQKWLCAMQGYAHVNVAYEDVYKHLKEGNHFGRALDDDNINDRLKEKIVQNVAIMYLRNFEMLEDETSLIHQLLARKKFPEIRQLIWFLWTLRKDGHKQIKDKIFELWPQILKVIDTSTLEGRRLASSLCDWTEFVDEVNASNKPLILSVSTYADENHHSYDLLRSIARISERQPLEAYEIWSHMLKTAQPNYPREAIQAALANIVRIGPDGIRKAKEIVSVYLKGGNELPFELLAARGESRE